ncbi:dual specificity protein phosphatase 6 [Lates japonicus]|uniref:Dual specificity protein phosphatase 6 n=1 Tax=Lates japonicus TaxID=270547 RepID=A0AAD3RB65_LATJO|nr:dual specificity protein phosphatase 6 [Lates japonicus]
MLDKLKPVVQLDSVMAISRRWTGLGAAGDACRDGCFQMDCWAQELYESSHVETAINVAILSLWALRRLKKATCPCGPCSRTERPGEVRGGCKTDTIVLYDEYSREWKRECGRGLKGLLLRRMKDEGYKAYYLRAVSAIPGREYPTLCETNLDGFLQQQPHRPASAVQPQPSPGGDPAAPLPGCAKDPHQPDVLEEYGIK